MIPAFPEFKIVEVGDREAVESHTHRYPPYSDFNFTSLWAWDTSNERMISELNGNLVVRFTDYATSEPFLSFLGVNKPNETAFTLLEYCAVNGLPSHLKLMPEVSVKEIGQKRFKIEEDRDNFDYIYSVPELNALEGGKYEAKRHRANKFIRENSEAHTGVIDLVDTSARDDIIALIHLWEKNKVNDEKEYELEHELVAIKRLFETIDSHNPLDTFEVVHS